MTARASICRVALHSHIPRQKHPRSRFQRSASTADEFPNSGAHFAGLIFRSTQNSFAHRPPAAIGMGSLGVRIPPTKLASRTETIARRRWNAGIVGGKTSTPHDGRSAAKDFQFRNCRAADSSSSYEIGKWPTGRIQNPSSRRARRSRPRRNPSPARARSPPSPPSSEI